MTATVESSKAGSILEAAEGLVPLLRREAKAVEDGRRLTRPVQQAFVETGMYRLTMPIEFGGGAGSLPEAMRTFETLARGDASASWSAWAACGIPAMSAFIPEEGAREMFSPRDACIVGSQAGMGRAVAVDGGYRVSGHWRFASGIHQATYSGGTCFVFDGDVQRMASDKPVVIFVAWPVTDCTVTDTWDTTGLRGTGSNDMDVRDVFVPATRVADFTRMPREGLQPLHYLNVENAANVTVASIAVGIAAHAIEAFRELGGTKRDPMTNALLAESPLAQVVLGRAETRLAEGRGLLYETAEMMWDEVERGAYTDAPWMPRTSLATVAAVDAAIEVATALYRAAGTSAVFRSSALDRCLRDLLTLGAHKTAQHENLLHFGGANFATA